jgi:hypothetical protein
MMRGPYVMTSKFCQYGEIPKRAPTYEESVSHCIAHMRVPPECPELVSDGEFIGETRTSRDGALADTRDAKGKDQWISAKDTKDRSRKIRIPIGPISPLLPNSVPVYNALVSPPWRCSRSFGMTYEFQHQWSSHSKH